MPEDPFAVIGRAADLEPGVEKKPAPEKGVIHPLVSLEELERPSPKPFSGRPDPDYPELDSGEPLYVPRFLVRKWGSEKFRVSAYWSSWRSQAERGRVGADLKPSEKKK